MGVSPVDSFISSVVIFKFMFFNYLNLFKKTLFSSFSSSSTSKSCYNKSFFFSDAKEVVFWDSIFWILLCCTSFWKSFWREMVLDWFCSEKWKIENIKMNTSTSMTIWVKKWSNHLSSLQSSKKHMLSSLKWVGVEQQFVAHSWEAQQC